MNHEELVNSVVAVALGEQKGELPPAEKLMTELCHDEPVATASITGAAMGGGVKGRVALAAAH